jgi:ABC-type antimicrobial peptide transport system permease subunit
MLRTRAAPAALLDTLMRRLARAGIAVEQASTLKARLAEALVLDRLVLTLVGACGLIALLMATLGVYGVINDAVRRRTREIGLRVALGAGRPQVIRLVMAEAVRFTAAGICVGVAAALSIAHFGGMLVQGLPGIDFRTFTAAPGILVAVVAAASIAPLLSALRVSPTIALRAE